jgi:hypothetical protein
VHQGPLTRNLGESVGALLAGAVSLIIVGGWPVNPAANRLTPVDPQKWLAVLLLLGFSNVSLAWLTLETW